MSKRIAPLCAHATLPDLSGIELPLLKKPAESPPSTPVLILGPEEASMGGRIIGEEDEIDLDAAKEALQEMADQEKQIASYSGKEPSLALGVAVDQNHPYQDVFVTLRLARKIGYEHAYLLARPSTTPPPPQVPDPELFHRLRTTDPATKSMLAAKTIDEAIVFCSDLSKVFEAIAYADPMQKCELLVTGTRESSSFPCLVDSDAFLTAVVAMWTPQTWVTFHTVSLDAKAKPPAVAEDATWGNAFAKLRQASRLGLRKP
ncbi:hypothetical protein ACFL6C_12330 [Myxococcota bacterium]